MALYPAYSASLIYGTQSSDETNSGDLHNLHPRYSCGLAYTDCGNGYCCDAAHQCVLPFSSSSSSSGQTLCRLPGFSTANAVATLASDATITTGSATATTTDSSSGASLSAGAIAGIAVGAFVVVALTVGAIVFLLCVRRRRKKGRAKDAAAASVAETGYGRPPHVYQPVPGGGGRGMAPSDMYAGSNVGNTQDRVPGRAEMMGDMSQGPVVHELAGDEVTRPVELGSGVEKKGSYWDEHGIWREPVKLCFSKLGNQ